MRNVLTALGLVAVLAAGAGVFAGSAQGGPPADCPDHDGDGICNGQDPDYEPGMSCPNPDCPHVACRCGAGPDAGPGPHGRLGPKGTCPNPDCPDDDGDGICNGQDPDRN